MKLLHKLLTAEKHIALLDRARHKSTREIERMVAQLAPKPFVAPMVRRLPSIIPLRITSPAEQAPATMMVRGSQESRATEAEQEFALDASPADTASAAPSSSDDRNLLRITIGGETKSKLDRAGDLLRHTIPTPIRPRSSIAP